MRFVFVFLALAGCDVFDRSLVDAGRDAPEDAPPCAPRTPPARPTTPDAADLGDQRFALRHVDFDPGESWRTQGYDLDGVCTDGSSSSACASSGTSEAPIDGEQGIDNAFGAAIVPALRVLTDDVEETFVASHELGRGAIVLALHGYSGETDDPSVEVSLTTSAFAVPGEDDTVPPPTAHAEPRWDGNDYVWLRRDGLGDDAETPLVRDTRAYVRDGVLVASFDESVEILMNAPAIALPLTIDDAIVTARFSGTGLEDVTIAGRLSEEALYEAVQRVGVCENDGELPIVSNAFDRSADLRASGAGSCDSVSIALVMQGSPVRLGGVTGALVIPQPCNRR